MCQSIMSKKGKDRSLNNVQKKQIKIIQKRINKKFGMNVLNVLSGTAMYEAFKAHQLMNENDFIPFNEAMCTHQTSPVIFSEEFIKLRAKGHQVPVNDYKKKVMTPLRPLFDHERYECVVLWFGSDMFCQMNVLTILAYLDQANYQGEMILHIVNEVTYEVEEVEFVREQYKSIYEKVLLEKRLPPAQLMPVLDRGIKLYLNYHRADNEIVDYIEKHLDVPTNHLLEKLFKNFAHYGLGDLQYIAIIDSIKKQSN